MKIFTNISFLLLLLATTGQQLATLILANAADDDIDAAPGEPGPLKVGEEFEAHFSPLNDADEISENGKSATYHVRHGGASYIAVHFADFNLDEGCTMTVSGDPVTNLFGSSNGKKQEYTMTGRGKMEMGTFWAQHIKGGSMIIKVRCEQGSAQDKGWFEIDKYAAGYSNLRQRMLRHDQQEQQEHRRAAICGTDDKDNAICYQNSHPTEYETSKAVARLLIQGSSLCTGWLVSSENHLITNQHCVGSGTAAANTDYEFMAEASSCSLNNCQLCHDGTVYSGANMLKVNAAKDYALVQLTSGNAASTYGHLDIDNRDALVGEQIYIPQYPGGRAKELGLRDTANGASLCTVYSVTRGGCTSSGTYLDVGYYCDTEGGSSGSPVISTTSNKVIALHHCANCPNRGVPIDLVYAEISSFLPSPDPDAECSVAADCADDGDLCTSASCVGGSCQHNAIPDCCVTAPDCNDGDSCTIDACVDNTCQYEPTLTCCGDGICEVAGGENCNDCPADCVGVMSLCGNGYCDAGNGENCLNCPGDCSGIQSGKPDSRYCCGNGAGDNPVCEGDSRCLCSTVPVPDATSTCCGDGMCQGDEDDLTCSADCEGGVPPTEPPVCGSKGASCSSPADCCSGNCKGNGSCN